jgi:hypothetical protein
MGVGIGVRPCVDVNVVACAQKGFEPGRHASEEFKYCECVVLKLALF